MGEILLERINTLNADKMPLVSFFQKLSLFNGVEPASLFELVPRITLDFETYQPGEVIINESAETMGLLYLVEGRVSAGFRKKKQQFAPYELLSFTGIFGIDKSSLVTLTALETSKILVIDNKSLLYLIQHSQAIAINYLTMLEQVTVPDQCVNYLFKSRME